MPKGYIMGMVTVTNPEGYKPYMQQTGELVAEYGGSYLVRGGNKTVVFLSVSFWSRDNFENDSSD